MPTLFQFACLLLLSAFSLLYLPRWALISTSTALILAGGAVMTAYLAARFKFLRLRLYAIQLLVLFLACGYFHHQASTLLEQAEQTAQLPDKQSLHLKILSIQHQQQYQTLIAEGKLCNDCVPQRLFVYWQAQSEPQIGEVWQTEGRLRPIAARLNFAGFDRQQWFLAHRITAVFQVKQASRKANAEDWRARALARAKQATADLTQQGLLLALGFGERAWLPSADWQMYQQTNTAHLIAISGLHIGLAMGLGFMLVRLLQVFFPTRWIHPPLAQYGGLLMAGLYASLAGFSIPTARALLALSLLLAGQLGRRHYSPLQWLSLVVVGLALADPLIVLSSSFWLSAGAVLGLLLWYRYVPLSLLQFNGKPLWGVWRHLFGLLHLQIGLLIFFTPLQCYFFHGLAANGFVANLLAVPFYSFLLVPLVLFAVLSDGALWSWQVADGLAQFISRLLHLLNGSWLNLSIIQSLLLTAVLALFFGLLLCWIYSAKRMPPLLSVKSKGLSLSSQRSLPVNYRRELQWGITSLIVLCLSIAGWQHSQAANWRLMMFDVGQGLAMGLFKENRGLLFDTGGSWANGSMAQTEILPYLQRQGITIEQVILSHDDNDHAGGINAIFEAFPFAQFISPSYKAYTKVATTQRQLCQQGQRWQWLTADFSVLWPPQAVSRAKNADSCVVLVRLGDFQILLTGDADLSAEAAFSHAVPKLDVLQVGHHGSKTASSEQLIKQAQPKTALISSGRFNPWHFPHQTVLDRLSLHQADIYNSGWSGAVQVDFSDKMTVTLARDPLSPWFSSIIGLSAK